MEGFGPFSFSDVSNTLRKKRSNASRRPRNGTLLPSDYRDFSSLSSTPSENMSKVSTDENNDNGSNSRILREEDGVLVNSDEDYFTGSFGVGHEKGNIRVGLERSSKGVLSPANWKGTTKVGNLGDMQDELESESRVKVKLKVGGVTRTIHAASSTDNASDVRRSSTKSSWIVDSPQTWIKGNPDGYNTSASDKVNRSQGFLAKEAARSPLITGKGDSMWAGTEETVRVKQRDKKEAGRKSKYNSKKQSMNETLDSEDDEEDEEIRYLEKLKTSKLNSDNSGDRVSRKQKRISRVYIDEKESGSLRLAKEGKKSRPGKFFDDADYVEEEEPVSDMEPGTRRKKLKKEIIHATEENKKEMTVITRQQALQTGKDVVLGLGPEFPNGLPVAPSRKQKEKLSEVEQQLKKAEAAQRRRMLVEKAKRESEAEAIRKILGQDSTRKKREERLKKQQENLAKEKAANALTVAPDCVRWVMGPSGTVVTFPYEMGLPAIFHSKPCSYPPPREKCAGPSCTNPYKYRDSKSKLPLCSLECYKAINEKMHPVTA